MEKLFEESDLDQNDEINYYSWVSTDRTQLDNITVAITDYISRLVDMSFDLNMHDFIAKSQSRFFKTSREELNLDEAVVILDFAENYSFVVQDAVQGFHWNNDQATLHPFCIYYKDEIGTVKCYNLCVISDCMVHDAYTVYTFLTKLIEVIKSKFPDVKMIKYFTDGAGQQYKNRKNLQNLCFHEIDFGVKAEWHFFATSHGKGPCDGVGGTVKRLAARASMQNHNIRTPKQLFDWAVSALDGIKVVFVSDETVKETSIKVTERMENSVTVKGSRSFHSFKPINTHSLLCAITSESHSREWQEKNINLLKIKEAQLERVYTTGSYVACVYDSQWWLGMISQIEDDNSDYEISFMHPHGPTRSFYWPSRLDKCYIPADNVMCEVATPTTITGRQYTTDEDDIKKIGNLFSVYIE